MLETLKKVFQNKYLSKHFQFQKKYFKKLIYLQLFSNPKVNDSEVVIIIRVGKDDIERLEVKMNDTLAVNELDTPNNLLDENLAFFSVRQ